MQYEAEIQALMLDRLGLEPILAYAESTGIVQTHAWPTYFSAVYPPAGGVKVLIGETVQNGLAGRLLEVFLDLPNAVLLTRVRTARKRLAAEQHQAADQIKQASDRDELRVEEQRDRLAEAKKALVALDSKSASAPSVTGIARSTSCALSPPMRKPDEGPWSGLEYADGGQLGWWRAGVHDPQSAGGSGHGDVQVVVTQRCGAEDRGRVGDQDGVELQSLGLVWGEQ